MSTTLKIATRVRLVTPEATKQLDERRAQITYNPRNGFLKNTPAPRQAMARLPTRTPR